MRPMLFMPPQPSLLAEAESGEALQLPKQHVHESVEAALPLSLPPSSASLEVTEEEVLVCTLCYQPSSAAVRLRLKLSRSLV